MYNSEKNFNFLNKFFLFFFASTESYLSTGPDLTIEYLPNPAGTTRLYGPSSAFKLRYEFLDTSLGGAPLEHYPTSVGSKSMPQPAALLQIQSKSCDRVYRFVKLSNVHFKYLSSSSAI